MSTLKRAKVVMLPTEKSNITLGTGNNSTKDKLYYSSIAFDKGKNNQPQHLYFLSDEEIKEGDWVLVECSEIEVLEVRKVIGYYNEQFLFDDKSQIHIDYCKKIIAATDNSIGPDRDDPFVGKCNLVLPSPSEGFLDVYVDFYNRGKPITEVMVEYELTPFNVSGLPQYHRPKVNPKDNTITIHKCKDSWNREEVKALALQSFLEGVDRISAEDFDKWIEENL